MELDKDPFRAAVNMHAGIHPDPEAVRTRGVSAGEIRVLQPRHYTKFAPAPIQPKGTLDEQEMVGTFEHGHPTSSSQAHTGIYSEIMRFSAKDSAVIERINLARLRAVRRGRHGE